MATEVPAKDYDLNLYDSGTGTNESLPTLKAVDFTEDCPNRAEGLDTAFMLFGRARRGRIVLFDLGSRTHFFIDELDAEMNVAPRDDTFGSRARILGLTKQELRALVEQHAPT